MIYAKKRVNSLLEAQFCKQSQNCGTAGSASDKWFPLGDSPQILWVNHITEPIGSDKRYLSDKNEDPVGQRWPNSRSRSASRSWPLFGLCQTLFTASVRSTAVRLTTFFGSTYLCEEAFCQLSVIKTRYRSRLTDDHSQILPSLVPK